MQELKKRTINNDLYPKVGYVSLATDERLEVTEKETLIPINITIRLIRNRVAFDDGFLKASVKLELFGLCLNDISVVEDYRGTTSVKFPTKTYQVRGETKKSTIFHPISPRTSTQFNHVILNAYTEATLTRPNSVIENIEAKIEKSQKKIKYNEKEAA